jgi:hypothetical protein
VADFSMTGGTKKMENKKKKTATQCFYGRIKIKSGLTEL